MLKTVRGEGDPLTPMEARLLAFMLVHPGRLYSRAELLVRVWGVREPLQTRTVDVHIANLRRKLDLHKNLVSCYKRGYLYRPCQPARAQQLWTLVNASLAHRTRA